MDKLKLREGLMGRIDRKYCPKEKEKNDFKNFSTKIGDLNLVKEKRFSFGKR